MARGALVRLQARDGSHTSDNEPSLACHASASITGCVRKFLLRLRPFAYLTRDHWLGAAFRPLCFAPAIGVARRLPCGKSRIAPKRTHRVRALPLTNATATLRDFILLDPFDLLELYRPN